jgi:putative DNA primase/helicase
MRIRRMYVPSIDARPTAKLMMACNGRPKFRDKSGGLWRRMILIPVNRIIPREERTKGMTEIGYWAGEVSGIFNWALSGLARLLEQGGFSECKAKSDAVDDYRHDVNPSLEFLELYLEPCEHGSIRSIDIYQTYLHWCKSRNLNPLGERQFGKEMRRLHPCVERKQKRDGRERYWSIERIRFTVDEIEGKKVLNGNLFS